MPAVVEGRTGQRNSRSVRAEGIREGVGRMKRDEGEDDVSGDPSAGSAIKPLAGVSLALLLALGLFLLGNLAYPGEYHEADGVPAFQSWIPILVASLMTAAALATAGFLLGALRKAKPAPVSAPQADFRELFAAAPHGLALLEGVRVESANAALENLAGSRAENLVGQDFTLLFGEAAEGEDGLDSMLGRPAAEAVPAFEASFKGREGAILKVEVTAYPFPWNGRAFRLVEIRDISDCRNREEICEEASRP